MAISYNGTTLNSITYNNTTPSEVRYNGTKVWPDHYEPQYVGLDISNYSRMAWVTSQVNVFTQSGDWSYAFFPETSGRAAWINFAPNCSMATFRPNSYSAGDRYFYLGLNTYINAAHYDRIDFTIDNLYGNATFPLAQGGDFEIQLLPTPSASEEGQPVIYNIPSSSISYYTDYDTSGQAQQITIYPPNYGNGGSTTQVNIWNYHRFHFSADISSATGEGYLFLKFPIYGTDIVALEQFVLVDN